MKISIAIIATLFLVGVKQSLSQNMAKKSNPKAEVEKVSLEHKGKTVKARRLHVSSHFDIPIDTAWKKVQTPALLQFVAKGKVSFKAVEGKLPNKWKERDTVGVKMKLYGVLPMAGTHFLFIEKIDWEKKEIQTREWDNMLKVWDHKIRLTEKEGGQIEYVDEIIIYAGALTPFVTLWAKSFL